MKRRSRWRAAGEWGLVGAITLGLTLGLLEIGLRLFAPQVGPEMQPALLPGLFVPDARTVYRSGPGTRLELHFGELNTTISINQQGLREDHEIGPPAPGSTRLLALGDSFTFGWGVDQGQAFPALLNGAPLADGTHLDSVNGGVTGYGPDNEAAWLDAYGWPLQPRIALVGFFVGNDVRDAMLGMNKTHADPERGLVVAGEAPPPSGPVAETKAWLARHSQAYVFLRRVFHDLFAPPPTTKTPGLFDTAPFYYAAVPPDIAAGWDKTTGLLDGMRAAATAHGARFIVVAIPAREQIEDAYWQDMKMRFGLTDAQLDRTLPQEKLAAWSTRTGTPLIDLLPGFRAAPGGPFYFRQDPHWTPAGHALAAQIIRAELARRGGLAP